MPRGGFRPNAKRPALYGARMKRTTISQPQEYLDLLQSIHPNISQAIRDVIEHPKISPIIQSIIKERKAKNADSH